MADTFIHNDNLFILPLAYLVPRPQCSDCLNRRLHLSALTHEKQLAQTDNSRSKGG
jgi:hypothetical protein